MGLRVSNVQSPGFGRPASGFRPAVHVNDSAVRGECSLREQKGSSGFFLMIRGKSQQVDSIPDLETSRRTIETGTEVHEYRSGTLSAVYEWDERCDAWLWLPGRVQAKGLASTMRKPAVRKVGA